MQQPLEGGNEMGGTSLVHERCIFLRISACRSPPQLLAVIEHQRTEGSATENVCLFQHRVEDRREVAGRGIDDLQHLRRCGLLVEGLARLGNEPRVLHRDHRLRGEVLQQRNLLVGEGAHLLTCSDDHPQQCIILAQRYSQRGPCPARPGGQKWVVEFCQIAGVNERRPV